MKLAYIALLTFSCLLAFLALYELEQSSINGEHGTVHARGTPEADSARVLEIVTEVARRENVNIGLHKPDPINPQTRRHLYLTIGDQEIPSGQWLVEGYPSFDSHIRTDIHELSELRGRNADGYYKVFGDFTAVEELRSELTNLGFSVTSQLSTPHHQLAYAIGTSGLRSFLLITIAAVASLIMPSVVLGARSYGVQRLHGWSFGRVLLRDLGRLTRFLAYAAPILAVGALCLLYAYNGLNQVRAFGWMAAAVAAFLTIVALAAHIAALGLVFHGPIAAGLQGRVRGRGMVLATYAIRVPVIVLACTVAVTAIGSWQVLERVEQGRDQWASVGDASRIALSGTAISGPEDEGRLVSVVGSWLHGRDRDGAMIVSERDELTTFLPIEAVPPPPRAESLVVNHTYLEHHDVRLESGDRVRPAGDDIQVLIPPSERRRADAIVDETSDWLASHGRPGEVESGDSRVLKQALRPGQSLFTYGSYLYLYQDAWATNPVVIVVPDGFLDEDTLTSYATHGSLIFPDPGVVADARAANQELGTYLTAVQPVAKQFADHQRTLLGEFRFQLFNLAAAIIVLMITAVGLGITFTRRNAQRVFVRHLCGWSFVATYRTLLASEATIAAVVVGWVARDVVIRFRALDAGVDPIGAGELLTASAAEPVAAAVLGVVGIGVLLVTLAVQHNRFVTEVTSHA